ncbi:serine/threonine-protein kinase grp isoform X2 [Rhodnius prolixus]|uniref:serine/threonine-protein kinase grp isoform X2 n=1 Tax=Rhodnius prolixus TaxID=13249 RepID=UPI003D18A796
MDFVEDWSIAQTLGEGAYGEVKLLINKKSGDCVAMKSIDITKCPEVAKEVKKEVAIHRLLKDSSIIEFYGTRSHAGIEYIFLEYAPHGELFDRIEPDVGMPISDAHKYMGQLLDGIEYLHERGIAHRDIKPENLLLDEQDNLKISDFGLATVFRAKGKERPLDKKCGTLSYVAPEVLCRPYAAQPADIWSCGIVLVAMLAGEVKKKLRSVDENASSLSQVESASVTRYDDTDSSFNGDLQLFLSQPVRLCDMLVSTQLLNTQSSSTQNCMQKLVRRMTRFFVNLSVKDALEELKSMLDKLTLSWKSSAFSIVTINTVDKRNNQLIFKCNVLETEHATLMDFRLSRGCGLEFKRQFVLIRSALHEVIIPNKT